MDVHSKQYRILEQKIKPQQNCERLLEVKLRSKTEAEASNEITTGGKLYVNLPEAF